jgi:hypothetical protein
MATDNDSAPLDLHALMPVAVPQTSDCFGKPDNTTYMRDAALRQLAVLTGCVVIDDDTTWSEHVAGNFDAIVTVLERGTDRHDAKASQAVTCVKDVLQAIAHNESESQEKQLQDKLKTKIAVAVQCMTPSPLLPNVQGLMEYVHQLVAERTPSILVTKEVFDRIAGVACTLITEACVENTRLLRDHRGFVLQSMLHEMFGVPSKIASQAIKLFLVSESRQKLHVWNWTHQILHSELVWEQTCNKKGSICAWGGLPQFLVLTTRCESHHWTIITQQVSTGLVHIV